MPQQKNTIHHTLSAVRMVSVITLCLTVVPLNAFAPSSSTMVAPPMVTPTKMNLFNLPSNEESSPDDTSTPMDRAVKFFTTCTVTAGISAAIMLSVCSHPAHAENELSAKYGGKGFDSSLVDQTCLVDKCSLQAKACLKDDPDCRKGLTCTAKCMGDNACITGCMARYGDSNLDELLKCTIEDNNCIKVAILDGGADKYGEEPRSPAPTVRNFNMNSMEGQWYKVVGYNPNYDCYACQKNTFTVPDDSSNGFLGFGKQNDKLEVDVRFSMPRMMPDGTPPPPRNEREVVSVRSDDGVLIGSQSIGFNDYQTREVMVFDKATDSNSQLMNVVLGKGTDTEASYARTAHSEGEMFGLSKSIYSFKRMHLIYLTAVTHTHSSFLRILGKLVYYRRE